MSHQAKHRSRFPTQQKMKPAASAIQKSSVTDKDLVTTTRCRSSLPLGLSRRWTTLNNSSGRNFTKGISRASGCQLRLKKAPRRRWTQSEARRSGSSLSSSRIRPPSRCNTPASVRARPSPSRHRLSRPCSTRRDRSCSRVSRRSWYQ